jgi:hypothetical protein
MFTAELRKETALHNLMRLRRRARTLSAGHALAGAGIALIPWIFLLRQQLPETKVVGGWCTAWVGLDAMEAIGLLTTGVLLVRRNERYRLAAVATTALLVVDAWFDLTTSAPGSEQLAAIAMAAGAEIPIAVACASLALRRRLSAGRSPDQLPAPWPLPPRR